MSHKCTRYIQFIGILQFFFKDFLYFSGRVESRDNICIIEKHQIDRNHTCIYLAKSHLSSA